MPKRCRCCLFTGIRLDRYNHHNHCFHLCFESSRTHVMTQIIISIIGFRHCQSTYLMCFRCHDFDHTCLLGPVSAGKTSLGGAMFSHWSHHCELNGACWFRRLAVEPIADIQVPTILSYHTVGSGPSSGIRAAALIFLPSGVSISLSKKHSLLAGQTIRHMTSSRCKWEIVIRTLQSCQNYANSGR